VNIEKYNQLVENQRLADDIIAKEFKEVITDRELTSGTDYSYPPNKIARENFFKKREQLEKERQDKIKNYVIYKKEKIEIFSDEDYPYGFSFNKYRSIIVIWDKDYDTRLLACSNTLSNSSTFSVYAIFQSKGELRILFKDNIPSKYNINQFVTVQKSKWVIKEVYSYHKGEYFLYPNCSTIDFPFALTIKRDLEYKSNLDDVKTVVKGFDIINDIKFEETIKEDIIKEDKKLKSEGNYKKISQVKSDKQYSYILFLRDKYKTIEDTKEDFKWIWDYDVEGYGKIYHNDPRISKIIYYKNIPYSIYFDRTQKDNRFYEFGYSIYKGVVVEWDEDYDIRIFVFVDDIKQRNIKDLVRCKEHEAGLTLYFNNISSCPYKLYDSVSVYFDSFHDSWTISDILV
jgi:hypothetical protein